MGGRTRFRKLEISGRFSTPPDATVLFDGKRYSARRGEPLALTLLAHGVFVLGRSAKYHRPRGLFCGRGVCGHCVAEVDDRPNQRLCECAAADGVKIASQNVIGSAEVDLLSTIDWLFPAGLDHHHLMTGSKTLNRVALAMVHELSGLGRLPPAPAGALALTPEKRRVAVAVVGGGQAGQAVAQVLVQAGLDTVIIDPRLGSGPGVLGGMRVIGFYDDRTLVVVGADRHLWLEAAVVVIATGGVEQLPWVPGNDLPGVLGRRAADAALAAGILPGLRPVVAVDPEADRSTRRQGRELVLRLQGAGAEVRVTFGLEPVSGVAHALPGALAEIVGRTRVKRVVAEGDTGAFECDALIWCGRPLPAYDLPRQMGLETPYDPGLGGFELQRAADGSTTRPGLYVAGEVAGVEADQAAADGSRVGAAVAAAFSAGKHRAEVSHGRA
ncbi:MAG: (2Fe-2S)-binding protein [Deltaproteobacteria bacterium]|nr:(2Fe-2S)-binding protein [Deltaproteobacteria bacterium]